MNVEKLTRMAGAVRTGGKGSVRRKKKDARKPDDKTSLKRTTGGRKSAAYDITRDDEYIAQAFESWRSTNHAECVCKYREPVGYGPPFFGTKDYFGPTKPEAVSSAADDDDNSDPIMQKPTPPPPRDIIFDQVDDARFTEFFLKRL